MSAKLTPFPALPAVASVSSADEIAGLVVGTLEGIAAHGQPVVSWGNQSIEPRTAQVVWMPRTPDWAACTGLRVILGFENGDEARPFILGLLDEPCFAEEMSQPRVLQIESSEELILECGKAKISLRADGRVAILGGYVLSHSTGPNKIKGGSVQIN